MFEGNQGFFTLFLQSLPPAPACPFPLCIPHSELRTIQTLPLPKGYTPFAAQIPPPAAPEPAIQSASQPGPNFPDEPFLPHRFILDKPAFCWSWPPPSLKPVPCRRYNGRRSLPGNDVSEPEAPVRVPSNTHKISNLRQASPVLSFWPLPGTRVGSPAKLSTVY